MVEMAIENFKVRNRPTKRDQYCDLIRNALIAIELQRRAIHMANTKIAETIMKLEEDLGNMRSECEGV
jgi:hypothetical protein